MTKAAHDEEVKRPADLPVAGQLRIPLEPVRQRRRHRGPGQDRQRRQNEHHPEVRQLLEGVVVVEAVRLRRQVERGVVDEDGPGVGDDLPGVGHQALPLVGREQQYHEDHAVPHPEQHAEEVPVAGHADGVPVAGQADPGGEVAGIILGRPEAVLRHLDRREPEPLRPGRAVDVPVQPGVVREDLQAAADEQDDEEKVDVVGDAQPGRKAMRLRRRLWDRSGGRRHRRQAEDCPLDVSGDKQKHEGRSEQEQCFASNAHDRESFQATTRARRSCGGCESAPCCIRGIWAAQLPVSQHPILSGAQPVLMALEEPFQGQLRRCGPRPARRRPE